MGTISFINHQKLFSQLFQKINLRTGIIIWFISVICSLVIMKYTNFEDKYIMIVFKMLRCNIYHKIILIFLKSILNILLIALCINVCAIFFRYKTNYLVMLTYYLYLSFIDIIFFPIQLMSIYFHKVVLVKYCDYLSAFIEFILLIIIINMVYRIRNIYKVVLIGIVSLILFLIIDLFPIVIFENSFINNYFNNMLIEQNKVSTNLNNFIYEIPKKVYKSYSGNKYKIKVQAEVEILSKKNTDSKEYLSIIVKDCVEASIYSYIYMSDKFDISELKKRVISQSNQILVKHNVSIRNLIFFIE